MVASLTRIQIDKIERARLAERFSIRILLNEYQVGRLVESRARDYYIETLESQVPGPLSSRSPTDLRGLDYMRSLVETRSASIATDLQDLKLTDEQGNTQDRKDKTTKPSVERVRLTLR